MITTLEMPEISSCQADDCAYNRDTKCHARAITVGGMLDHRCDTILKCHPAMNRVESAGVGACKVLNCTNNEECECQAPKVDVGFAYGSADCLTFKES